MACPVPLNKRTTRGDWIGAALALFGRRPSRRVDKPVMSASETLICAGPCQDLSTRRLSPRRLFSFFNLNAGHERKPPLSFLLRCFLLFDRARRLSSAPTVDVLRRRAQRLSRPAVALA